MIYDLHNDLLTGVSANEYDGYLARVCKQSVKGIILAFWTTELDVKEGFFQSTVSNIRFDKYKNVEFGYAVEDLHFLENAPLSILSELPFKYVGLTWNYDNALAGGALGTSDLLPLGKRVLKEAERLNIAVDTAHLNEKSFYSVVDSCGGKVMNSHCCFDEVFRHPRNLTARQIQMLVERNGIIGVTLHDKFLSKGEATAESVVRHIDYFVQKFGPNNLCIGSDFNGCRPPEDLCEYDGFRLLKIKLLKLGYTQSAIDGIFYKNAIEFFT